MPAATEGHADPAHAARAPLLPEAAAGPGGDHQVCYCCYCYYCYYCYYYYYYYYY